MSPVASDRLQLAHFTASGFVEIDGLESEIQGWLAGHEWSVVRIDTDMCSTAEHDPFLSVMIWYEAPPFRSQPADEPLEFA